MITDAPGGQACYPAFAVGIVPGSPPSTGFVLNVDNGAIATGTMNYSIAAGSTVSGLAACSTEMAWGRLSAASWAYNADPRWAWASSF